ncbi:HlyD family type I secretion periplasmic adaptor subunit [Oculatella sp. LEGE 06141]|uniref:HlyD family type I secretion periplasmic adaptor subunit n=1 Tax=Oculatella sp. LEGE 06141 TaxID=1828648 RepID=UPI00188220DA|nr:HlyD family type I secretion periplasmic adaptor subunit [Oculatella sp. LEGE 06141]MBE9180070.1 HlyD family type I secretion periplasmic adaptor subunit [Oculatella sp. LEGE 06141]
MRLRHWLVNPLGALRGHYQTTIDQVEHDLTAGALSLPSPAVWTKRLTQVIIIGMTAGVGWSIMTRVDVVIPARGRLDPISQSQAIQSRVGGVVTAVLVREGEQVKQGQLLMQLDKTALLNQLQTLMLQQEQLVKETAVLRMARQDAPLNSLYQTVGEVPPELMNRVQTRLLLVAQLTNDPSSLSADQRQRYELFEQQLADRVAVTSLQGSSLQTQIASMETQLDKTEFQMQVEQELLSQLQPLLEQGAISRTDFLRRAVDVNALQSQMNQDQLQKRQLQLTQMQAQVTGRQLMTETYQELQSQLAALDAEFDTTIKTNQNQMIQVNSQLNQVQIDLKQQDLRAPVDGIVFNMGPKLPGIVAQPGQSLMQVVPSESLIARVQVANADIANIRVGMPVDVRIDAYPFTEYGSVDGIVTKVGSEALAVSEQNAAQTVFPVEIRLEQQFLERGEERLTLVPGMSLVANIKVRDRSPISYVAEELIKAFDGLKSVR